MRRPFGARTVCCGCIAHTTNVILLHFIDIFLIADDFFFQSDLENYPSTLYSYLDQPNLQPNLRPHSHLTCQDGQEKDTKEDDYRPRTGLEGEASLGSRFSVERWGKRAASVWRPFRGVGVIVPSFCQSLGSDSKFRRFASITASSGHGQCHPTERQFKRARSYGERTQHLFQKRDSQLCEGLCIYPCPGPASLCSGTVKFLVELHSTDGASHMCVLLESSVLFLFHLPGP